MNASDELKRLILQLCSVLHYRQPTSAGDPWQPNLAFLEGNRPCLGKEVFPGGIGKRSSRLAAPLPLFSFSPCGSEQWAEVLVAQ